MIRVSSPCPKSWLELPGNDRVRYCAECKLNVYNLADLSREEIEKLVRRTQGRLCGRLYRRAEGTATLGDCPASKDREIVHRIFSIAAVLGLALFGWLFHGTEETDQTGSVSSDRIAVDVIPSVRGQAQDYLGEIEVSPVTTPSRFFREPPSAIRR